MKKNSESLHFSKSGLRNKKSVPAMNRKSRTPQLESLEERQLLSAVSMSNAEKDIQSEVFYVTLSNANDELDNTTQYVAMHIQGDVSATDVTIENEQGHKVEKIKSVQEEGITTLLLKEMGLGTNYIVTVRGVNADNAIDVFFTTPGDLIDGDGVVSEQEYYTAFGNVVQGQGMTQNTAMIFQRMYGVNLSTLTLNEALDMNNDGLVSQDELNLLVKNQYTTDLQLRQTITVKPTIENLSIGADATTGIVPEIELCDAENQGYVTNFKGGDGSVMPICGKLPTSGNMPIVGEFVYTDSDGNDWLVVIEDMLKDEPAITVYGKDTDGEFSVELPTEQIGNIVKDYDVTDGQFTLELKDVKQDSNVVITLSYSGTKNSANTYSIQLSSSVPKLVLGAVILKSECIVDTVDGKTYTQDKTPNFVVETKGIDETTYNAIIEDINNPSKGITVALLANSFTTSKLVKTQLTGNEFVRNGDVYDFSLAFETSELEDAEYTFTVLAYDRMRNETDSVKTVATVDCTKPVVTASNYNPEFEKDGVVSMYVNSSELTLEITVDDVNFNNATLDGNSVTLTDGKYTLHTTLEYGLSTFVFVATDKAGNKTEVEYHYTFNQVPLITENGQGLDGTEIFITTKETTHTIEDVALLFGETDGSTIDTTKISVSGTGTDKAVTAWNIDESGNLVLTLNTCEVQDDYTSLISISYTDEYGEKAFYGEGSAKKQSVDVTFNVTNDTVAPVVTFDNKDTFKGKIDENVLVIKGDSATLDFTATDKHNITTATVTIAYKEGSGITTVDLKSGNGSAELTGLTDGTMIVVTYTATDNYGNTTTEVELATLMVDASISEITSFTSVNDTPSNKRPEFNVVLADATSETLKGKITYKLADDANATEHIFSTFDVSENIPQQACATELEDGKYIFTVTIWDNAGNETKESIEDYIIDTTAPKASITNVAEDENGLENDAYTLNFTFSDDLSGVAKLILTQNDGAEVEILPTEGADTMAHDVTLTYGQNKFTLKAIDKAGNESAVSTFDVIHNEAPVANAGVISQIVSTGSGLSREFSILDYITDDTEAAPETLNGTVVVNSGKTNTAIDTTGELKVEGGKLLLTLTDFGDGTVDDADRCALLDVSVTDEFGKTVNFQIDLTYVFDNEAPSVNPDTGLAITGGNKSTIPGKFAVNSKTFSFTATVTDYTGIETFGWKLIDSTGATVGEHSGTGTAANPNITVNAEVLDDGVYTLVVWGKDTLGNESTEAGTTNKIDIIVDSTAPTFTGSVTIDDASSPTNVANHNFDITTIELIEENDCKLVIHDSFDNSEYTVQKQADGKFPAHLPNEIELEDGTHTFTYKIVDVAGNEITLDDTQTVVVDTEKPTVDISRDSVEGETVYNGAPLYVDVATATFTFANPSETITKYYKVGDGTATEYTDGIALTYGENVITLWGVDATGNASEEETFVIYFDHAPTTVGTLADRSFDFPANTNTVTVSFTKAEIMALFSDADNDISYTYKFTPVEALKDAIEWTSWGNNGDVEIHTFTLKDKEAIESVINVGTMVYIATDAYGQTATSNAVTISKNNLPPRQIVDKTLEDQTQNLDDTPSYTWDLADFFRDPEGDTCTITDAEVSTENSTNGTCVVNGTEVTWTPANGKYGNAKMSVTVSDGKDSATFDYEFSITWAGIQGLSAEPVSVDENAEGIQTVTIDAENAFDATEAWGNYAPTTSWEISDIHSVSVNGYTISEESGRVRTACNSLFVGQPTIEDGVISYALAENAYGKATLVVSAGGKTTEVEITINNVNDTPYTVPNAGSVSVNSVTTPFTNDAIILGCDGNTDEGNISLAGLVLATDQSGISQTGDSITIVKGETTYVVQLTNDADGYTFTLVSADGVEYNVNDTTAWEALDGTSIDFTYTAQNVLTGEAATNIFTVTFSALAKTVTKTVQRSNAEQTVTIDYNELCQESGGKISIPDGQEGIGLVGSNVVITIAPFVHDQMTFTYNLTINNKQYAAKIHINFTDVNWAPVWSDDTEASQKTYEWTSSEAASHELDLSTLIKDNPETDTSFNDMNIAVKENALVIVDGRSGQNVPLNEFGEVKFEDGKLVCTPDDPNFYGTVSVTLSITDTAINSAPAETADFKFELTVKNVPTPPEWVGESDIYSVPVGDTEVNLSEVFADRFQNPDGSDKPVVTYNGSETYTVPDQMGIHKITITATTGSDQTATHDVFLAVSGSANIEDESLNPYAKETNTYTKADGKDITLPTDFTLAEDATLEIGSMLKAGTVLNAGTAIAKNTVFECSVDPVEFDGYFNDSNGSFTFTSDFEATEAITLQQDMTLVAGKPKLVSGSLLKAGSIYGAGSTIGGELTIEENVSNVRNVMNIYNSRKELVDDGGTEDRNDDVYSDRDTLLEKKLDLHLDVDTLALIQFAETKTIDLFDATGEETEYRTQRTIQVVATGTADSPFQYIGYDASTQEFSVYYRPYSSSQNRSALNMVINLTDGSTLKVNVSTNYEKPFEVVMGLTEGEVAQDKIIQDSTQLAGINFIDTNNLQAGTYTYQVWVRCNLPWFDSSLDRFYSALGFVEDFDITFSGVEEFIQYKGMEQFHFTSFDSETGNVNFWSSLMEFNNHWLNNQYLVAWQTMKVGTNFSISEPTSKSTFSLIMDGYRSSGVETVVCNSNQITINNRSATNAIKGVSANRETIVQGNGIYMSAVTEKSEAEQVDTLPKSVEYLTEWDSSWVELWVNTQERDTSITKFSTDLAYDAKYFTATDFEYSSNVANGTDVVFRDGKVVGISGDLTNTVTNEDGFVLVGRVKLEAVAHGGVATDTLNAVSMGLSLSNVELRKADMGQLEVNEQVFVNTKVFAVVYDANDDGQINILDLVRFARMFGQKSIDTTDARVWAMDFDNSGKIDILDLVAFARNYGKSASGDTNVTYPKHFFQTWIGATLKTEGDANIADTLDTAIQSWSEKLGEELNIEVQIIVKDFENVAGGNLAETMILGCDEAGKPNAAVIYLDSDALGKNWYTGESDNVVSEQYDLYTVMLHELGHALGMSLSYDGYCSTVDTSSSSYTTKDGETYMVFAGHVYGVDDLMNDVINTGVRKEVSSLDAEIVSKARAIGGEVHVTMPDAICGVTSDVTSGVSQSIATGMMTEAEWNGMLIQSATKVAQKMTEVANDCVWDNWDEVKKTPTVNPNLLDSVMEEPTVQLSTAGKMLSQDELFNDDDFASQLEDIALETLRVKLNEEK